MVIVISVTIGFIVIFQAMYTAVMERTREIGILKSIGASKFYVVNVILRETLMLALGGIVLGILISLAAARRNRPQNPNAAGRGHWRLDLEDHRDRNCGRDAGGAVPGIQSGPKGPHRGFSLRIARFPLLWQVSELP